MHDIFCAKKTVLYEAISRFLSHFSFTDVFGLFLLDGNQNQWSEAFYTIVSKAATVGTLLGVDGSYDNRMQVVSSECYPFL